MKTLKNILAVVGLVCVSGLFIFSMQKAPSDETIGKEDPLVNDYNVYALEMPEGLNFAGEKIPVENPDIHERMDRELLVNTYWQSNGLLMFKRAQKYFPVIEPILKKNGVPDDFKYLAVIESGLTNAVSPAGARGFWQIMKATGRENGLEVNNNVDERYNLEMATEVACKYLIKAKEQLGSWTLAAAAYNAGNAGISRRLKEQGVSNYYDLLLGEETGRYMFRIVALKEILNNPSKYGFNYNKSHLYKYIPTYKVEVDTAVTDFSQFAKRFGINYKILKIHNPWLREPHLNNKSRKLYTIEIPKEGYYNVQPGYLEYIKEHIWQILIGLNYVLATSAVVTVLFKKINPTKTLSYIIVLLVFPFVGLIVYYLFGQEYRKSKIFNRKHVLNQSVVKQIQQELELDTKTIESVDELLDEKSKLIRLLYNSEKSKLTVKNEVKLIKNGDKKMQLLLEDLNNAKHHIHIEYFIIKDDTIGTKFLDVLCYKAKEGIKVKIVIDDVGSDISSKMKRKLKDSGVELRKFMPVLFSKFTGKMNYRDHRKIAIIDGKIGYVGGINISDNYVNSNNTRYWRDTHIRIVGEAVRQLQILFFTTWDFTKEENVKISKDYFPENDCKDDVALQIAASGPDTDWSNIMESIFIAITNAEKYIHITTPYFIPNDEIVTALQVAARSNIEVKLIVPKKSDSWIAEYATNSYLEKLLEAGVEVYQYTKGFVHAKTMVIDDVFSTVGTANMDYRSFNINFEVNALIYDRPFAKELNQIFSSDLEHTSQLKLDVWKKRAKSTKLIEALARLAAPLL